MANYVVGILLITIIVIIALWAKNPIVNAVAIGTFAALAAGALWTWLHSTPGAVVTGKGEIASEWGDEPQDATVDGGMDPKPTLSIKITMKDILRNAKQGIMSISEVGAIAASGGLAGDTVVEALGAVLDATLWMGQLAAIFLQNKGEYGDTMRKIYSLDFKNGVNGVHDGMRTIVANAGGASSAVFLEVRRVYSDTMEWLLSLLGTAISIAVPDDAGTVGWAVREALILAIRAGSTNVFWAAASLYNALPNVAKSVLQNPEDLRKVVIYAIEMIEKYILNSKDEKWWKRGVKTLGTNAAITVVTFGLILMNPLLMFPIAGAVFVGGQLANGIYRFLPYGANAKISALLHSLYEKQVTIPGIGSITAVEALVLFMQKITVLTFAGLYILSDADVAAADAPPADFVPPSIDSAKAKGHQITVNAPPALANIPDPTDAELSAIAPPIAE